MIDPATLQAIVSAIPREAWSPTMTLLVILAALRWLGPMRAQAIPAKGSTNGAQDTLHVKLDRVIATVDRVDSRVGRIESRVDGLDARMDSIETDRRKS